MVTELQSLIDGKISAGATGATASLAKTVTDIGDTVHVAS
jgi:hypothetical protein